MAGAAGEAFAAPRPERAHASPCLWSPCPGCPAAAVLQECAVQGASMAGHDGGDSPGSASWGPRQSEGRAVVGKTCRPVPSWPAFAAVIPSASRPRHAHMHCCG